jgi:hypothetical protein
MSGHPYLQGHRWLDLTRDERFFCAELYFALKRPETLRGFVHRLNKAFAAGNEAGPLRPEAAWEVGLEVAFYRDHIHAIGHQGEHHIKRLKDFSQKRTFDLCLFSENLIVIIEAKSFMGLVSEQVNEFRDDRKKIQKLLGITPEAILLIGLWSSGYTPRTALPQASVDEAERVFDGILHWNDLIALPALTDEARRLFALADATRTRAHGQVPDWSVDGTAVSWRPVAETR